MSEEVVIRGDRTVRATLDAPEADACVVACPPHPRHGGNRSDPRLVAVSEALSSREIACLRFDYGPWGEGEGERQDVENAIGWTAGRYPRIGLFGYSLGATLALLVAADRGIDMVSALAPTTRLVGRTDIRPAIDRIVVPVQLIVGSRDEKVEWQPVADRARDNGATIEELSTDHAFAGEHSRVGELVAAFAVQHLLSA